MDNLLFLCGYYPPEAYQEIKEKSKTGMGDAANLFQDYLIRGFSIIFGQIKIVSAPFIGSWPNNYKEFRFQGFIHRDNNTIKYIKFNNIWGYRNISRTKHLQSEVEKFIHKSRSVNKYIIIYSPHTPFLKAAVHAKKLDSNVHICIIIPDLPQYMNLNSKLSVVYKIFKKIDLAIFYHLNKYVDTYVLLTEQMKDKLSIGRRESIIVEAISDRVDSHYFRSNTTKQITYSGKLLKTFGVMNLVNAFKLIKRNNIILNICGEGELHDEIVLASKRDTRIRFYGHISPSEARRLLNESDVLVNPRCDKDEYTKFSFPSKLIEYLKCGGAVIAYKLEGMPSNYSDFVFIPKDESVESLKEEIIKALDVDLSEIQAKYKKFSEYANASIRYDIVARRIANLIGI